MTSGLLDGRFALKSGFSAAVAEGPLRAKSFGSAHDVRLTETGHRLTNL